MNLILVPESSLCDIADFHLIAEKIRRLAPDIRVHVIKRRHLWWRQLAFLFSPSLYVAFYEAKCFKPVRGLCLHGAALGKSEQYRRLQAAGIEVIPWQRITRGENYTREIWGYLSIVKPDRGSEGIGIFLSKPENINFEKACHDGKDWLIQKFVETGDSPTYFRALCLFGEVLYLRKTTNSSSRIGADSGANDELPTPVANAGHGNSELVHDGEVIEFAKQIANRAFPSIPLLGQDIVRDRTSGKLYCLEVNPSGSTWHFSTPAGLALQKRDNIDYRSQFDAFTKAAQVLIEKGRLLAR